MANKLENKSTEEVVEYKTFKDWFRLMRQNHYILFFLIGLGAFIGMLTQYDGSTIFTIVLAIPVLIMIVIAYKGFYQHWRDMQNKTSR